MPTAAWRAAATGSVRARARPEDGLDRRPDRVPPGHRAHRRAHRRTRHRHRVRPVPAGHLPRPHRPRPALRAGARHARQGHAHAGARAGGEPAERPAALAPRRFRRGRHRCAARDRRRRAGRDGGAVRAAQCRGPAGAPARAAARAANSKDVGQWRRNGAGAQILADLGLGKLRVLGTPRRQVGLAGYGLEVVETIAATALPRPRGKLRGPVPA
jgi:hypothetical protein